MKEENKTIADTIRDNHASNEKGIFRRYILIKMLSSMDFILSILVSIIMTFIIAVCCNDKIIHILDKIISTSLSIIPNLLGFCIGGYAIIIGITSSNLIDRMSKPLFDDKRMSLFQVTSAIFAISIIIQLLSLIYIYAESIIISLKIQARNDAVFYISNYLCICITIFLSIYSMSITYSLILSIFNFGQTSHSFITIDKYRNQEKKD